MQVHVPSFHRLVRLVVWPKVVLEPLRQVGRQNGSAAPLELEGEKAASGTDVNDTFAV